MGRDNALADLPTFVVDVALQHCLGLGKQLWARPAATMDQNRSLPHWHLGLQAWEHSLCCSRAGAAGHQGTEATGAPEMVNRPDKPTTSEGGTPAALGMLQGNTTCLFRTEIGFAPQVGPWVSGDGLLNMSQGLCYMALCLYRYLWAKAGKPH